jgi:hypothetical protein
MASDDGTWSPYALKVSPSALREASVSEEFWFVYLLPPLVPIPFVRPQLEGSSGAA